MRAVWVNEGTDVTNWDRLRQLGISHVFYDLHKHGRAEILNARSKGFLVGGYTNPEWFGFETGATISERAKKYRTRVSQRLTALGVNQEQFDVQFNIEKGAIDQAGIKSQADMNFYIKELFRWWRLSNAKRATSWTMEGHQGGWFTQCWNAPTLEGTTFVPQAYDGNMNRWDSFGVVMDLVDWGAPLSRVIPFNKADEVRTPYSEGFFYMEHLIP